MNVLTAEATASVSKAVTREASAPPALSAPALSQQQEAFILDRFSTTLEDPTTGLKIRR